MTKQVGRLANTIKPKITGLHSLQSLSEERPEPIKVRIDPSIDAIYGEFLHIFEEGPSKGAFSNMLLHLFMEHIECKLLLGGFLSYEQNLFEENSWTQKQKGLNPFPDHRLWGYLLTQLNNESVSPSKNMFR